MVVNGPWWVRQHDAALKLKISSHFKFPDFANETKIIRRDGMLVLVQVHLITVTLCRQVHEVECDFTRFEKKPTRST